MEDKLDQDFLFYLDFTSLYFQKIKEQNFIELATDWLQKLCSERCVGIERKRCRNVYLAQLLLQMQDGRLKGEFLKKPYDVDIGQAFQVFQPMSEDLEDDWMQDVQLKKPKEKPQQRDVGNTIVASRTLKDGQGAFAYVGISLAEDEPKWVNSQGGGDLAPMQKVLSKRKTPQERQNCVNFFDVLLKSICNELNGEQACENEVVDNCLESLIKDLMEKNEYDKYKGMNDKERRNALLCLLRQKVVKTKNQVLRRTEALDTLVTKIHPNAPTTFTRITNRFEIQSLKRPCGEQDPEPTPMGQKLHHTVPNLPDRNRLSDQMWAQVSAQVPSKKHMARLVAVYPPEVIERFLTLLRDTKGILLARYQNRHEQLVNQMQKELSDEIDKNLAKLNDTQKEYKKFKQILKLVRNRYTRMQKKIAEAYKTDTDNAYGEDDIQELTEMNKNISKTVNEQSQRGKTLAQEVNSVMAQIDKYKQVLCDIITKSEEANQVVENNIANLKKSLDKNQEIVSKLKNIAKVPKVAPKDDESEFLC